MEKRHCLPISTLYAPDDTHNVYAAELIAIRMAITAFQETTDKYGNVYIFADNQSATIQAVDTPMRQIGTVYY